MSRVRDMVTHGNKKVVGCCCLLRSAKNEEKRELYRSRVERERRLLDELHRGFPDRFAA